MRNTKYIPIIILLVSVSVYAKEIKELNADVVQITNLIKQASEPGVSQYLFQQKVTSYQQKISRYAIGDKNYVAKVSKLFIDLELAVWDGLTDSYNRYGTAVRYRPQNDPHVSRIIKSINSYGIPTQKEDEIPGAAAYFDEMGRTMPKQQFMAMLAEIRIMMQVDYYKVYNGVFN
jgi:hypothetical protein